MFKIVLGLVAALGVASAANAMTIVASTNGPDSGIPAGQHLITDFSSDAGLSGTYQRPTGSVSGQYAAPFQDATSYLAVLGGNTATLAISPALKALSFYWGSVDDYNTVSFFSGRNLVASFTGSQIPAAPADGSQGNPLNNRRVSFNFGGEQITSVNFSSGQNAFELDTVSGAVPEPATWALLIVGMGMTGAALRRRRGATSVAA